MAAKHSFTKEQVAEYLEHFNEFDEDGSGSIEAAELKSVLDKCGVETTDTQVQEMIKEADRDGSGSLEFEEFLLLMWRLQSGPSEKEVRNEAFTMLDDNMDGFVTLEELKAFFKKNSSLTTPSDAMLKEMLAQVSTDGTQMTFDDFTALLDLLGAGTASATSAAT